MQGAFSITGYDELEYTLNALLADPVKLETASETCSRYVSERTGATRRILDYLEPELVKAAKGK
jgi:Cdc6-like AAA superfamily ATPase